MREKAELQSELDHIMEENESLKSALQLEQQETASLKVRLPDVSAVTLTVQQSLNFEIRFYRRRMNRQRKKRSSWWKKCVT